MRFQEYVNMSIKKLQKQLVFLAFTGWLMIPIQAQTIITGTITDKTTRETLPGVNVYMPEYARVSVSDENGHYLLKNFHKGNLLLQFSFVGYRTVIKNLHVGQTDITLDIQMEPSVINGEEVVVTGGFPSSQHENVVKISTLKPEIFRKAGTPSFIKILTEIPGIDIISKGPGVGTPVIRGLSMSNILFLNNGVPLENFQFSENHPFLIDDDGIDRVEVIKGPASLLYGSGAVGGVFNIIKEAPAPKGIILGDFHQKYFSNTHGISSGLGIRGTTKSVTWGIRGSLNSHMDYFDGEGNRIPNTRFNTQALKFNLGILKSFGSFRFFYDQSKNKLGMAVEPAMSLVTSNSRKNEVWYQDLTDQVFSSKNKIFLGGFKIDLNAAYQRNNRKLHGSALTPVPLLVDMQLNTFTYKLQTALPTDKKTKVILGVQGMNQINRNGDAPQHVIPDAWLNDFSVFGLGQHYHWDKLMIQAGARWDNRYVHVPEHFVSMDTLKKISKTYHNMSASLGATLNLCDSIHFRFNVASAFRSPNIAELTQFGEHGTRFEKGNPDLISQKNLEADLSFHYHSRHTTMDIAGFFNNIYDYIHLSPTNDTTGNGDKIYLYSQNHAFLYGGEVSIHIHPPSLEWLHLKTTYSYVLGKKANGEYLPFIPAQKLNFEVQLNKKKWKFFRDLYISGNTNLVFDQDHPAQFETTTGGYVLINCGIGGDIPFGKQKISLGFFANNLLNTKYIDHLSTLKDLGLNNMGRNITVSLKVPFVLKGLQLSE